MPPGCDRCGSEPEKGKSFTSVRKNFSSKQEVLCPECLEKRVESEGKISFFWIALVAVILILVNRENQDSSAVQVLINLGLSFYLISPLSVFLHELAHAVVAKMCRFRIFSVEMGWSGRELINTRILGTRWILRWFPANGLCRMAPHSRSRLRLRLFLAIAAGPLINLSIAVAIALTVPRDSLWNLKPISQPFDSTYFVFWMNLLIVFSALRPKHYHVGSDELYSDGMQLQLLLKNDQKLLDDTHKAYFIMEAAERLYAKEYSIAEAVATKGLKLYPDDTSLNLILSTIQFQQGQFLQSLDTLGATLDGLEPDSPHQALIKNNIAYFSAVVGDENLYTQADTYSLEALRENQSASAIIGTRGAVLVRLGKNEEGLELLQKSIKGDSTKEHRAENYCWVALAHFQMGNPVEARTYLNQGKVLNPDFNLIDEVRSKLESSQHD